MQALKKRVRSVWDAINTSFGNVTATQSAFVTEMKAIGDRRYKETCVTALARFQAILLHESCLDAYWLITDGLNFAPDRDDYEYRYEILDAFLSHTDGLELIKTGLEQLFDFDPSPQDKDSARGILELLERRETNLRGASHTAGSIGTLSGANA